ncbi:phosphate acyltransferase PlsX [Marinactinospora thermotolerans]|uniref:Phosphate acyltransferase n=1 Tax=Marinactinospora thermotolerans DSM 45154 TaxID=1122192 RepID=A0A1T4TFR3_9ACTN|nr:phosphate acyltransferase PlsX [Marinactinospora thermotolerans]SKA39274.1 phosphate:acyl-[acyl carrier protein] acyltransferase [Marinactinospora thermotolerans DSM 45154]
MTSQSPAGRPSGDEPAAPPVIAVDAMGGDHAPREIVAGAVEASREHGLRVILVGRTPELLALLSEQDAAREIPIVHAEDTLAMHEGALASWRRPRSSVAVACKLIRQGDADALVSAGSTGGVVATSTVRLRTQPGVLRPALAVVLPTLPTPTILVDAGANADAKPEMLVQFAHLGVAYAQTAHGIAEPRVGLLTIGTEPGKGNRLTRKAAELLAAAAGPGGLDYRGNIEGHDLLAGRVDVVVADGFTGNVALKSVEGAVRFAFDEIRGALTSGTLARAGALLQRRALRGLRDRMDSESYGGAVLLGLNGTVVIAHGDSHARGVAQACRLAHDLVAGRIVDQVRRRLGPAGRAPAWLHRRGQPEE